MCAHPFVEWEVVLGNISSGASLFLDPGSATEHFDEAIRKVKLNDKKKKKKLPTPVVVCSRGSKWATKSAFNFRSVQNRIKIHIRPSGWLKQQ